jgi:ribosomal protein L24
MAEKFKIKKGDQVIVTTGRDKGKKGEVLEVLRAESRVRVQGINMVKRLCIFRMLHISILILARQHVSVMR